MIANAQTTLQKRLILKDAEGFDCEDLASWLAALCVLAYTSCLRGSLRVIFVCLHLLVGRFVIDSLLFLVVTLVDCLLYILTKQNIHKKILEGNQSQ